MTKRSLVQGTPKKPGQRVNLDKPVPMLTKRKRLPESPTRRAIRWFGELRTILHDPDLAEPGDLYHGCPASERQAFFRRVGRARIAGARQHSKDLERRESDAYSESWRKATPLTNQELIEMGTAIAHL